MAKINLILASGSCLGRSGTIGSNGADDYGYNGSDLVSLKGLEGADRDLGRCSGWQAKQCNVLHCTGRSSYPRSQDAVERNGSSHVLERSRLF